jgi:hypothetical protein
MCVQDGWGPANYRLAREMLLLNHGIRFRTLASYGAAEAIANAACSPNPVVKRKTCNVSQAISLCAFIGVCLYCFVANTRMKSHNTTVGRGGTVKSLKK